MKYFLSTLVLFILVTTEVAAFCTWGFVPSEREYRPLDATEVFISYQDGKQTLVLQPEWQGNAKDLAIVYPTPSKPEVIAAPANIFNELNDATNPFVARNIIQASTLDTASLLVEEETVTIVEEKQVGEYQVTVLTATDAGDLVEWLEDNGFNYTKNDASKVAYYVAQKNFHFVALKVDASHFDSFPRPMPLVGVEKEGFIGDTEELRIAPSDWFWGQLSPIQISFTTDQVQLPMRTLKSNMPKMTFDVYTLSDKALYVPGVDTIWSNLVDAEFLSQVPSLLDYAPKAKWLVRQEVTFDPSQSEADLYFEQVKTNDFSTVTPGAQVRLNPAQLNLATGIIPGARGKVVYTDEIGTAVKFGRSLTLGAEGEDVKALQQILNAEGFVVANRGAGSIGNETIYFGGRTKQALVKYQNFYRSDILTPVGLTYGTGYFGPSTIAFINQ